MPEICRFFGIIIQMNYDDHNPPHFHAIYNEFEALISIKDLKILEGDMPSRAIGLVMEWTKEHRKELIENWELAQNGQSVFKIQPL